MEKKEGFLSELFQPLVICASLLFCLVMYFEAEGTWSLIWEYHMTIQFLNKNGILKGTSLSVQSLFPSYIRVLIKFPGQHQIIMLILSVSIKGQDCTFQARS